MTRPAASKASDLLMSYLPSGGGLTNFYWDDWALSGLLKKEGATLTLGLAGGTGPRRLAAVDPRHRQTGVDLDTGSFQDRGLDLEVVTVDAVRFLKGARRRFDTIWVDLYNPHGILADVLRPDFLDLLRPRLDRAGVIFFHLFRPQNRFYRYARAHDPFEPLFATLARSRGLQVDVFDHYASQTWALSAPGSPDLRNVLESEGRRLRGDERRWLDTYMLNILRRPAASRSTPTQDSLRSAFQAPPSGDALAACGLDRASGASDLDKWSESPEKLITPAMHPAPGNRLRWETMAMWLTGVGLTIPAPCRRHLERVARRHADTGAPEFERRRSLLASRLGERESS